MNIKTSINPTKANRSLATRGKSVRLSAKKYRRTSINASLTIMSCILPAASNNQDIESPIPSMAKVVIHARVSAVLSCRTKNSLRYPTLALEAKALPTKAVILNHRRRRTLHGPSLLLTLPLERTTYGNTNLHQRLFNCRHPSLRKANQASVNLMFGQSMTLRRNLYAKVY